jgi:hypothetical protein
MKETKRFLISVSILTVIISPRAFSQENGIDEVLSGTQTSLNEIYMSYYRGETINTVQL